MLFFDGTLALLFVALWLYCVIDAITAPEDQVRNLPKIAWVFITILLMEIGAVAWLVAGRPRGRSVSAVLDNGAPARPRPVHPDDDEQFLAQLRARAAEQRRRAAQEQPKPPPEA